MCANSAARGRTVRSAAAARSTRVTLNSRWTVTGKSNGKSKATATHANQSTQSAQPTGWFLTGQAVTRKSAMHYYAAGHPLCGGSVAPTKKFTVAFKGNASDGTGGVKCDRCDELHTLLWGRQ